MSGEIRAVLARRGRNLNGRVWTDQALEQMASLAGGMPVFDRRDCTLTIGLDEQHPPNISECGCLLVGEVKDALYDGGAVVALLQLQDGQKLDAGIGLGLVGTGKVAVVPPRGELHDLGTPFAKPPPGFITEASVDSVEVTDCPVSGGEVIE